MQRPKVIFLDAVGTLFGVKGSVGEVYREIALRFGVDAPAEVLNQAFFKSFKAAEPPIFPGVEPEAMANCEFIWWEAIARSTFAEAGVLQQFSDFAGFFNQLYHYFSTAEPWFVYPDVRPALEKWNRLGIELGVLSNFDSRLFSVLRALNLIDFFTSVTISSQVGAAKPDAQIFAAGLEKHRCDAAEAWHIGDSLKEDYQGASSAGLRAILIERSEPLFLVNE